MAQQKSSAVQHHTHTKYVIEAMFARELACFATNVFISLKTNFSMLPNGMDVESMAHEPTWYGMQWFMEYIRYKFSNLLWFACQYLNIHLFLCPSTYVFVRYFFFLSVLFHSLSLFGMCVRGFCFVLSMCNRKK